MAWPASTQTLENAFTSANNEALRIRARVQQVRDASAAGPIQRRDVLALIEQIQRAILVWNSSAAVVGIVAHARDQLQDPALDVAAEFSAMVSAATALKTWIFNNYPKDAGTGTPLSHSIDVNGAVTELTFTTAALADFRTNADSFLATIA